jgi:hypothetical protein
MHANVPKIKNGIRYAITEQFSSSGIRAQKSAELKCTNNGKGYAQVMCAFADDLRLEVGYTRPPDS